MNVPSGHDLARWFKAEHALTYQQGQTAEGFDYEIADDGYCYVWVTAFVDLDYDAFFLLDVRTKADGQNGNLESRDFLFVGVGVTFGKATPCEWQQKPALWVGDHRERLREGLIWFAERIEFWTEDHAFDSAVRRPYDKDQG